MESSRKRFAEQLKKGDPFYYDVPQLRAMKDAIREARYAPKPLTAMNWHPEEDDEVEITVMGFGAFNDEDDPSEPAEDEEENLDSITVAIDDESINSQFPSQMPSIPSWERSSPPVVATTPCPPRLPTFKRIANELQQLRDEQSRKK
ncbi:Fc.00g073110.m01.CDS01 [Cosmosporella sp. VM-42]